VPHPATSTEVTEPGGEMFGPGGNAQLDGMNLAPSYATRVESLRAAIRHYDREVVMLERRIHQRLRHDRGYNAIQAIPGVGRTIAAIFVAEIGDVSRFPNAEALTSWAGLAPLHRESDTKVVRGRSPKPAPNWSAGQRSKPSRGGGAAPNCGLTSMRSPLDAGSTRPAPRSLANFSRSSTTACATARSVAWPTKQRELGQPAGCGS
jgi:hypothetical protein